MVTLYFRKKQQDKPNFDNYYITIIKKKTLSNILFSPQDLWFVAFSCFLMLLPQMRQKEKNLNVIAQQDCIYMPSSGPLSAGCRVEENIT